MYKKSRYINEFSFCVCAVYFWTYVGIAPYTFSHITIRIVYSWLLFEIEILSSLLLYNRHLMSSHDWSQDGTVVKNIQSACTEGIFFLHQPYIGKGSPCMHVVNIVKLTCTMHIQTYTYVNICENIGCCFWKKKIIK